MGSNKEVTPGAPPSLFPLPLPGKCLRGGWGPGVTSLFEPNEEIFISKRPDMALAQSREIKINMTKAVP